MTPVSARIGEIAKRVTPDDLQQLHDNCIMARGMVAHERFGSDEEERALAAYWRSEDLFKAALLSLVAQYREALEPFAKATREQLPDHFPDNTPIKTALVAHIITCGDFRRAAAILAQNGGGEVDE
jgi:hypothetical protein